MNLGYAWSEILGKGERSLLNIFALAVAIALFISLTSFSQAYRDAAEKPFRDMGADLTVQGSAQLYRETAGVQVRGIGVWLLVGLVGAVWSIYFTVMVLVSLIARAGSKAAYSGEGRSE